MVYEPSHWWFHNRIPRDIVPMKIVTEITKLWGALKRLNTCVPVHRPSSNKHRCLFGLFYTSIRWDALECTYDVETMHPVSHRSDFHTAITIRKIPTNRVEIRHAERDSRYLCINRSNTRNNSNEICIRQNGDLIVGRVVWEQLRFYRFQFNDRYLKIIKKKHNQRNI